MLFDILSITDHDLLIQLNTKMDMIYTLISNHLEHHQKYTLVLLAAFTAVALPLAIKLFKSPGIKGEK